MSARETRRFAPATSARDRVVDELRLERVLLVHEHLDLRLLELRRRPCGRCPPGMISAPSTSPSRTLRSASSREETSTGVDALAQLALGRAAQSRRWPPIWSCSPGGTSFDDRDRGLSGPRLSESPISSATTTG